MDLSILMSGLSLHNQVSHITLRSCVNTFVQISEQDEAWDTEGLLREIQEELQLERDKQEDAAAT